MKLNIECQTDEFLGFKSGLYKSIVVTGGRKPWENGYDVNLGDLVVVKNGHSPRALTFKVSQLIRYSGASTLETALDDLKERLGSSGEAYENATFYLAPNAETGSMPFLTEGIYAIMIEHYSKGAARGDKNRRRNGI